MKVIAIAPGYHDHKLRIKGEVFEVGDEIFKKEREKDKNGNFKLDENGNFIYKTDKNGDLIFVEVSPGKLLFPKWLRPYSEKLEKDILAEVAAETMGTKAPPILANKTNSQSVI